MRGKVIKDQGWRCPVCRSDKISGALPVMSHCDHWVCPDCLDTIRNSTKDGESKWHPGDPFEQRGACPCCHASIYYVIPSDRWPTGKAEHQEIVDRYLREMGKKPCRDFQTSIAEWRVQKDLSRLHCRHGNFCHFAHKLPGTDHPYVFPRDRVVRMIADRTENAGKIRAVPPQVRVLADIGGIYVYIYPSDLTGMDPLDVAAERAARVADEAEASASCDPSQTTLLAATRARREANLAAVAASQPRIPEEIEGETSQQRLARHQQAARDRLARRAMEARGRYQQEHQVSLPPQFSDQN